MPPGIHLAVLAETVVHFGSGMPQRQRVARRLEHIYGMAKKPEGIWPGSSSSANSCPQRPCPMTLTTSCSWKLGRWPVHFRPYILHGAYWYESGRFWGNGWNSVPGLPPMPPEPRRILPVVPLISNQRNYGESPARLRRGPREGLAQGWSNREPERNPELTYKYCNRSWLHNQPPVHTRTTPGCRWQYTVHAGYEDVYAVKVGISRALPRFQVD